ncbi:MAG: TIGR03118 family protein [Nocardioidaceae bacterium]
MKLVADTPGQARITDPNLVNAWGLAESPTSPIWVSDNGTSTSTLYQGAVAGHPVEKVPLDVKLPGGGAPTGVVFNPTQDFQLSTGGKTGPALFIFAGENGDIFAWNQSGDKTKAVLAAHTRNAVYKGLTMVTVGSKEFLLAANFHRNRIDVFDSSFNRVDARQAFSSKGIPDGYAPFDVSNLGGRVYVTYAKQDPAKHDDVAGPGHGFLKVFDQRGHSLGTLVRRGVLDSPWGLAIAPAGFGSFAGMLLVGNFGDGRIHVVDPTDGHVVATLLNGHHQPITIDGLWGLLPGNGTAGRTSDVWFSAGPGGESHGLLGILRHR